jgi:DNA (cytosine-5)-methyltransferase 1
MSPAGQPAAPGPLRSLRAGSLCTGYGGLDLSVLSVLPAALAWCADPDPHAAAVLAARFPDVPNLGDLTTAAWAAAAPVDLVTAGFPCQDISLAGRGAGIAGGTRSGLWAHITRVLRRLQPACVLVENVAALRSRGLDRVLADLTALGHDTHWACLAAGDVGLAHRRDRLFILSCRPGMAAVLSALAAAAAPGVTGIPAARPGGQGHRLLPTPDTGTSPNGHGRRGGRPGNGHQSGQSLDAVIRVLFRHGSTPAPAGPGWGPYAAAIARHEQSTGLPAPAPAEPGPGGRTRLSAAFAEWLMALPPGWVTAVPGIPRTGQLRLLGNGVAPPQGARAIGLLIQAAVSAAPAPARTAA